MYDFKIVQREVIWRRERKEGSSIRRRCNMGTRERERERERERRKEKVMGARDTEKKEKTWRDAEVIMINYRD